MPPGTDAQAEFDQGLALLGQGRYDAAKETLRAAAEHGHAAAATTLGRLLCLDADSWLPTDTPGEDYVSAAEPWLRRALHLDPDDRTAALLLASLLDRQLEMMRRQDPWGTVWVDEIDTGENDPDDIWQAALTRRHDEAIRLLEHLLDLDPTDESAAATLVAVHKGTWAHHLDENQRHEPPLPESDTTGRALLDHLLTAARRAAELDPSDALLAMELADALRWNGSPEAAQWLRRFTTLRPEWTKPGSIPPRHPDDPPEGFPSEGRYGWYVLEFGQMVDNYGTNAFERLMTADPAELRWASEGLFRNLRGDPFHGDAPGDDQPPECLTLSVYDAGHDRGDIDLTPYLRTAPDVAPRVDWSAFSIPPLKSTPLPPGRPALSWLSLGPDTVHYGFSDDPHY
ncbi:tetratricopeptide repeat protein [Actinoallomurus sp. CA-150999]|uniref:tetratricopeptide repeat protein n=1 Tax=Actinoallomurus sp. CA-150999 TaxID=3239887 RepID=UPI003D8CEC7C